MRFIKTIAGSAAAAPWLLLGVLASAPASAAEPAVENTLTVAYANSEPQTRDEAIESHAGDALRVNVQLRADARAELDTVIASSIKTLLAAADPAKVSD